MQYVYVSLSMKDGKLYTGYSPNLREHFRKHQAGKVVSTKDRDPFQLVYYEACNNKFDALGREKYLKTGMGKRYLKNRLKRYLSLTG